MKTVLLLEDDFDLASHWKELLEELGHGVIHVTDTESAIKAFEESEVDLVISDILIRSPEGKASRSGGLSLLSHINLSSKSKPKILAVSGAHPQLNVLKHATAMKADRTLTKPIDADELAAVVTELLLADEV